MRYTLAALVSFDGISLTGTADFEGAFHPITFGASVSTSGTFNIWGGFSTPKSLIKYHSSDTHITVMNGSFARIFGFGVAGASDSLSGTANITIGGGSVGTLYGGTSGAGDIRKVNIDISSGDIDKVYLSGDGAQKIVEDARLSFGGGRLGLLTVQNAMGDLSLSISGGKVNDVAITYTSQAYKTEAEKGTRILTYNLEAISSGLIDKIKQNFTHLSEKNVVYVKDGGTGNGRSPLNAVGTLDKAYDVLGHSGGEIILCGPLTVDKEVTAPRAKGPITITSLFGDTDYSKSAGAKLMLGSNIIFNSETTIENIEIETLSDVTYMIGNGNKIVFGEGIVSTTAPTIVRYPTIIGGGKTANSPYATSNITINSGKWNQVRGGNGGSPAIFDVNYNVTVNGGEIYGRLIAGGIGMQTGKVTATVNGGKIFNGIYGTNNSGTDIFNGTIHITVNGGDIYGKISPAVLYQTMLYGTYNVWINGGDFSHLTDILGDAKFGNNCESQIIIADGLDITSEIKGKISYNNPMHSSADPRIILVDGDYYYVASNESVLGVTKIANVSDLQYVSALPTWDTADAKLVLGNLTKYIWPAEIQYFSS